MKRIFLLLLTVVLLTGCSNEKEEQMTKFENEMNSFCDNIAEINTSINDISAQTYSKEELAEAKADLLSCLDRLDDEFKKFSAMDFPEEFDYLEDMADESSEYMTKAVESYHTVYGEDDDYNENMEQYAKEYYSRAYKRVKIIISLFNGETPTDEDLILQ